MRAIIRFRDNHKFFSAFAATVLLLSACASSPEQDADQDTGAMSSPSSAAEKEDAAEPRGDDQPIAGVEMESTPADSSEMEPRSFGEQNPAEEEAEEPPGKGSIVGEDEAAPAPAGEPSDLRAGSFAVDAEGNGAGDLPGPGDDELVGEGNDDEIGDEIGEDSAVSPPANPLIAEDRPYEEPDGGEFDETAGKTSLTAGSEPGGGPIGVPVDSGITGGSSGTETSGDSIAGDDPEDGTDSDVDGAYEDQAEPAEPESREGGTVRTAAASPGDAPADVRHPALAAEAPDRRLDEPGEITVVLEGLGWVFRSDLSTPGAWRFLDRERDGDSTRFLFEFDEKGRWNLVFERQDLSSGGSDRTVRSVSVGETGTAIASDGTGSRTSDLSGESAEDAASAGRIGEALEILEREALGDGESGRRARSKLMELAAESGSTAPLVTWLPAYLEDGADADVLESALAVLEGSAGYPEESRMILKALSDMDRGERTPEWMYKLALSLERPGEGRDMDRAARLYDEVIRNWPLTEWRELSEERLAWLQRHYFRVR